MKKDAFVDSMLLWMVFFIGFATMLFMVINYAIVLRTKANLTSLSNYGARMISLNQNQNNLIVNLNRIRLNSLNAIRPQDLICQENLIAGNYQVNFLTQTTLDNPVLGQTSQNNVVSSTSVFNQSGTTQIDCILSVSTN